MKKVLIILIFLLIMPINCFCLTESVIDITTLSIKEIQEYVDKGYLTYEQIVNIYLERIDKYNKQYNAIITVNEKAIDEAKALDDEYKKTGRRSLVHGIPILVKDNIDVVGMPTTAGTKALLDSYPKQSASAIKNLTDNGAIIIGKTNMDEFAFNAKYSHSSHGWVYNAYNTKYSSYGSSGGSAVGVAANLAVAGIGSDTGVSIRVPSAANGIVGLRPTYGLVESDGVIKFESLRDVIGPMTKYVSDNAILLSIMDNTDINYEEIFKETDLKGVRIGVAKSVLNSSNSKIKALVNDQIKKLKDLGAEIVYVTTFYPTYKFDATTFCSDFNEYIQGTESKIKSLDDLIKNGGYTQWIDSYNGYYCNHDYRKTSSYKAYVKTRENNIKKMNNKFKNLKIDVLIYPTLKDTLLKIDGIYSKTFKTHSSNVAPLVGFPSMNIPIGFVNNLPYGMEILSQANKENLIYKIGYLLEQKNNFYKLPSIAPNLYSIDNNIPTLLSYYEEEHKEEEYITVKNEIKDFINNYNTYENKEEKINELIYKYEDTPNIIKKNEEIRKEKEEKRKKIITIISLSGIIVFIIILIVIIKINKKKSKHRQEIEILDDKKRTRSRKKKSKRSKKKNKKEEII